MFGQNYYPVQGTPQLEDGEYEAQIVNVEVLKYSNGNDYVKVTVAIKGHPGCAPDNFVINEAPQLGAIKANGNPVTKEDVDRANRKITRFFNSFNIRDGNFNFTEWKHHIGWVRCAAQYDKNEPDGKSKQFKALTPFEKTTDEQLKEQPVPVTQNMANPWDNKVIY